MTEKGHVITGKVTGGVTAVRSIWGSRQVCEALQLGVGANKLFSGCESASGTAECALAVLGWSFSNIS